MQRFGTVNTSHNTYLTVLVEYGTVGLLLYLLPWLLLSLRTLKDIAARPDLRWFMVGALGALVVFAFTANAGDYQYFSFVPAVPWILLGLLRRRQLAEDLRPHHIVASH